jgi:hypothetical protein
MRHVHWFSPRGARRGMGLAAIALLIWLGWAIGYLQGASDKSAQPQHPAIQLSSANASHI